MDAKLLKKICQAIIAICDEEGNSDVLRDEDIQGIDSDESSSDTKKTEPIIDDILDSLEV